MNLVDLENREKAIEDRFRTYRNVNRVPYLIKLPLPMFWVFLIISLVCLVVVIFMVIMRVWFIAIVLTGLNGGLYFILVNLIKKYGDNFLDKITSYYWYNTFSQVLIRGTVEKAEERLKNKAVK